jgi:hypothetical protein
MFIERLALGLQPRRRRRRAKVGQAEHHVSGGDDNIIQQPVGEIFLRVPHDFSRVAAGRSSQWKLFG